jgi:hypothetical protein
LEKSDLCLANFFSLRSAFKFKCIVPKNQKFIAFNIVRSFFVLGICGFYNDFELLYSVASHPRCKNYGFVVKLRA